MKLAILLADYVDHDIQPVVGDLSDIFCRFFSQLSDVISFDIFDLAKFDFPSENYRCDCFIITGSREAAYSDKPWINQLKGFVRKNYLLKQKMIGFCFGHQLIAEAMGGKVVPKKWNLGVKSILIKRDLTWMQPFKEELRLLFNHRDQVVIPPQKAEIIAGDSLCPVQLFIMNNILLGIQAHPEYSIDYQEMLMKKLVEKVDENTIIQAKENNKKGVNGDNLLMLEWLANFIKMPV